MGTIFGSIISKWYKNNKTIQLLITGLNGAGKTTIYRRLILGEMYEKIPPNIGFAVEVLEYKNYEFLFIDLNIDEINKNRLQSLYKYVKGLIFVVDSNDKTQIDETNRVLKILIEKDEFSNLPLLIYANKQDLPDAMSPEELNEMLKISSISKPCFIQGTSGQNGTGLYEGIDWLIKQI